MAAPCQPYSGGHSQCHLRRISSQTAVSGVADVIHFWKTVTLIGRKRDVVDYFLSCATPGERNYMSRIHARVIWTSTYELVDSSLTGVYVNDIRIHGRVMLQEGDTVTFGHPAWQSVTPGARARQPNSPFYFLFEHCHCSSDRMQHLHGKPPMLAAARASPKAGLGLKVALTQRAQAALGALPASPSALDMFRGCCRPPGFLALTPRLTGSSGTSSPLKDSVHGTSRWSEMPNDPQLGASPRSARDGSVQPASRIRRSVSPEYAVPEEEMPVIREASSQGTIHGSLIQESPGMKGSGPVGRRSKECPVRCMTGSSRGLSPHESCSSEARASRLHAVRPDRLPASPCPEDSAAADLGSTSSSIQGIPAELPKDAQPLACSVQTEDLGGTHLEEGLPQRSETFPEEMQEESAGDVAAEINLDSRLSPPGTKDQVPGGSDHSQETIWMEMDESTEETAHSDTCCIAEPGVQWQVLEWMEGAVRDRQVTSAGCSQDRRMGEEGTGEGRDERFIEMPLLEAALQETEWDIDGSLTEDSLADGGESIAAETSDLLSTSSGSKTPDDFLCEQEPDGVFPARLLTVEESSSRALTVAWPCEIQSGHEACEPDSQEDASDNEDDVEMLPYVNARISATGCPWGQDGGGLGDPEMESGIAEDAHFGELSCAEAGTQARGRQAKETSPVTAEPGAERGPPNILEVLQHCDGRLSTQVAKDTLQQQLPEASASDFLTQAVSPTGEFSEERIIIAAASSDERQEHSSSESLLETCKEDTALAAATSPAGMVWGKGAVLEEPPEADFLEEPMDLGGTHLEEGLPQRSETFPEGMQEESAGDVAAEREVEPGSPGLAGVDAGPEGQLVAYRLGCEQEGSACAPLAAAYPGAGEPDSPYGHESQGGEEADQEGASGREESEVQSGESVATAFQEGVLENQLERSCGSAGSSPAGNLRRARGHAKLLPPLEKGRSPRSGGICVGSGLSFQRSEKDAGSGLEDENSHLLPKQGDLEDEQDADLNDGIQAVAQGCVVGTEDLEDARWRHEMTEPEKNDAQEETQAGCVPFSGHSPHTECLEASPPSQVCQEPEWQAGEPPGLAGSVVLKPQRADVEQVSLSPDELPMEGGAWEDICEPGGGVERSTPPMPEGCSEEVLLPEQGKVLQQSLEGLCCKGGESNFSQVLCTARTLQESTARNLHGENQTGSAVVQESSSSDELNLQTSNSEAEREENDSREAVIPKERDTLMSDSAGPLDGVNENSEACSEVTEQCTTHGPCEAASQDAGVDLSETIDTLQEQNSPCSQPCCNVSGATIAAPWASRTDTAMGEKSPSSAKAAGLGASPLSQECQEPELQAGEPLGLAGSVVLKPHRADVEQVSLCPDEVPMEARAVEGTALVPLNLLHAPEKDSCLLESDAKLGGEEQTPGGPAGPAEEVGLDLLEGGGMLDSRLADQPGLGTLELSETPEENLQSEIPASIHAEGFEGAQKMEGETLLSLKQEIKTENSQEDGSPSEEGPGCSDGLGSSEYSRIPSTKEEASEGCSSRKRHFGEGQVPGTLESESDSSSKKRLRPLHSRPDQQSSTKKLPAPLDLERHREQFDRTVGKFLQQCSSQATLHSGDVEGKNRDIIAKIVRTYFTSTLGLEEPVAESLKAAMSAQPLEAGSSEDADCKPAAGSEPEKSTAGKESGSSPAWNAEPCVSQAQSWDPTPHGKCSPASTPSRPLCSHTQQPGREVKCQVPESACKAYLSEEEEFQASISSLLQQDSLMENVLLPKAMCVQESCGKNMDVVFSDVSRSSVASVQCEPSPDPDNKSSTGIRSGMLSEAAERDLCFPKREAAERDLCFPKPSDVGWCAEDTSASSTTCVSPHKSTQTPKGTFLVELDAAGDRADAAILQSADGTFDGEDGHMSPSIGASQWVTSCLVSSVGETREELDDSTSRMQTEDGALCQRSHGDSPSQGEAWPCADVSAQNTSVRRGDGAESGLWRPWASSEQDVAFQLQECQAVLEEISESLCAVEGIDDMHMVKWREQIAELQKATKMPKTSIAVVGNTGAGKSSLLNALLEEEAVLPTSAMRACTAVVVEVSRAAGSHPYEADVEFLSREEWFKELHALLEDMKDKSGNLKKRCPDPKTEAGAAYSRVKAVYGRVDKAAILEAQQDVTQHLGTVKNISAETAADFCAAVEKFISSRTDNLRDMKGGEFWPIVKCVKIRVAKAEVLKTGVVLVDLPGVRDSNAARDNAAKEYLKSCDAVWVVASITRAVDDKTAKEILNINLRRQLFMDGQYGNLAFICTKTDSFNITDIVRDLDLREEIQPLEGELEELEAQRRQAEEEKGRLHLALLQPEQQQRQGADAKDPAWLQRQHDFLEKEFRISSLQKQKDAKLRAISLVCVQARNRFSKQRIRMDFNAGLEELKRKAELSEGDNDGDEDMEDGDLACSDAGDLGEAESQQEKLHVFTVSSTEYLKLSGKFLRDGPTQVFHDPKDTEIPALKNFAIETGLKNSMKATEKLIRDVARIISNMVNYLTSQQAADISHQAYVQEVMQQSLQDVPRLLQEAVDDVLHDIQYYFEVLIKTNLQRGSNKVKGMCEDMVKSWGLPVYGLPHATYHAACRRHGAYSSPRYRSVDFNEELAKPIYEAISTAWNEVFSSRVEESFNHFTKSILDKLKTFFRDLWGKLRQQSSVAEALQALHLQQMEAVQARLCNFLLDQGKQIRKRQRTISRLLSPFIQAGMEPVYAACRQMSGRGYFQRMKNEMESYVRNNKDAIFDSATENLQRQLELLQNYIQWNFQSLVDELCRSLRMQFEPLLKPVQKNARIIPDLMNICAKVDKICKRSCVDYILPSTPQAEASAPQTGKALQGNSACFSAMCTDTRLRAGLLPHVASVQQPTNDAEKLLDVPVDPSWLPPMITVVQQPQLVQVNLQPYGGKRVGEALQPVLEKRRKSQACAQEAGPDPPPGWSMKGKMVPFGPSAVPCHLHTSRECVPENCRWKRDQLLGTAQLSMPASELNVVTGPGSTGAPTQAEEEKWGKRHDQGGP